MFVLDPYPTTDKKSDITTKIKMSSFQEWLASNRIAYGLLCLALAWQAMISVVLGSRLLRELGALQTNILFKPNLFQQVLATWGDEEITRFNIYLLMDCVQPVLTAAACAALLTREKLVHKSALPIRYWRWLILIAFGTLCDYVENGLLYWYIRHWAELSNDMITILAVLSIAKWAIFLRTSLWFFARYRNRYAVEEKMA